jgi:penicillin-binding protein 1A
MRPLLLRKARERPSARRPLAPVRHAPASPPEVRSRLQPRLVGAFRLRRIHILVAALASLIIVPVAYVVYCIATIPSDGGLVIEPTPSALIVEAADGQVFATRGVFKGDKLTAQDVPANLSRAIVAIEDRHFYEHGGFYLPSMLRAAIRT